MKFIQKLLKMLLSILVKHHIGGKNFLKVTFEDKVTTQKFIKE